MTVTMDELNLIQKIIVWSVPVLLAITVHEVAHGWTAKHRGDPTAMMLGRLTLNPLKHIDPIGTIVVPGLLLFLQASFIFGWAKPVPVTWQNLKHPKRDMALVAIAGPAANLIMAILWAILAKIGAALFQYLGDSVLLLIYMGWAGASINIALMVLNLLPIPPLDGGRVLVGLLPTPWAWHVNRIEPYGLFIVIGLLVMGILQSILIFVYEKFLWIFGLS
uniref:Zn-dependent protease (Includes SpoIVFB) n=1 Tax=Candidatus Kentrum sp. LFY TaxID=2126342 RepID=A0A450UCA6_9GAMM|nr:MAG: Zn-dependent protease (includes SpoIVFB) [Candidatus Kentron sp. LFY]VFJ89920.1 MAG: Zn-dependent protease (includes SpoIVFB) [Candidatus Kentron sp. LFY]VFK15938.1 MAG: Zn-dependent protease (includes SpoIVFB) [Candidatus Kentron sp. LFY]